MAELDLFRKEMDQIDEELTLVFLRRMRLAREIAKYKKSMHLPLYDPAREEEVLTKVVKLCDEEMGQYAEWLYGTIFAASRSCQQQILAVNKVADTHKVGNHE